MPPNQKRARRSLSHLDAKGDVRMVDVGRKRVTRRQAVARGRVFMHAATLEQLRLERMPKGNVLATAHLAAVMAAKRTSEIVPLAHPVPIEGIDVAFSLDAPTSSVGIEVRVRARGRTGVEMEALTGAMVAALTLYDMMKAADPAMVMGEFALWEKRGGRSGVFKRRA